MFTRHRVEIAAQHATNARDHVEQLRKRIARLRAGGRDATALETDLARALPIVERFEIQIRSMREALARADSPGA